MLNGAGDEIIDILASDEEITRRKFCGKLALTSLCTVAAGLTVAAANAQEKRPALVYPAQKIEGAERLLPGSSLFFAYPTADEPAILIRISEGQYVAYSQKCTHLGCSIYFDRARRSLECPCHKGAYDVQSGRMIYGPPPRPLDQISLQMRAGGEIWATGKRAASKENFA
jgi:Rieske Fe-S protein